ncbi:PepSY-associated TM helix domain-containing protein [Vibrio hepatarius]|uniref:PepSY-associated TM helix domain-containing protein n=1 Tax=Vibrio hepatarius TaxID=171383 RepID=UPI00142E7C27|nr:PepSY domain-containing protein [Vibrio hepatarius]NIY83463.1 PepSY domain-containing protein [Vibrio hepatarius]
MLGSQTQTPPKDNARLQSTTLTKARYFLAWRWHFYAGLFVVPFMIMLSLTGLVMLFDDEIEQLRYQDVLSVVPLEQALPASQQIAVVKSTYPEAAITQFISSKQPDIANRVSIRFEDGKSLLIAVNPYTAQVQGEIERSESWYELANNIHGTLLVGKSGDFLIEIAASLSLLLLATGIYMWLPTDNASRAGFLKLRVSSGTRVLLRDIHANLGGVLSVVLLLFVLSGLAWAGVWGAKMVQGWNTFPTYYTWGEKPQSNLTHASLNHGSEEELPWNLEHSTLPQSQVQDHSGHHGTDTVSMTSHATVSIDQIIDQAKALGFTQFKVFMPKSETGVYTVAANSMAGDVIDPRQDRTTHFDQYSGEVLVDVTWDDYTLMAKLMAAGVSLHQGDVSVINKALNALFCLAFIAISITGVVMWWKRRPVGQRKLGVPAKFQQDAIWKSGLVCLLVIGVCFPLAGFTIAVTLVLDWLLVRRSKRLQHYFA